jgi:hypothetical protein
MGEGDLFPSPHEQSIGGIGPTTQRRGGPPMPPMVPMLHCPEGRTSRIPGHLTHSPKDGPELGAEFPSR